MSRRVFFLLTVSTLFVAGTAGTSIQSAQADDPPAATEALITKTNFPGFRPASAVRTENCEIFADRVVITRVFGLGHGLRETRQIELFSGLAQIIADAANEAVTEKPNFLCDGPGTVITAGDLLLYSTGGCGTSSSLRTGSASAILRDMVSAYCPTTH
jgi:hypothetical protein